MKHGLLALLLQHLRLLRLPQESEMDGDEDNDEHEIEFEQNLIEWPRLWLGEGVEHDYKLVLQTSYSTKLSHGSLFLR